MRDFSQRLEAADWYQPGYGVSRWWWRPLAVLAALVDLALGWLFFCALGLLLGAAILLLR